MPHTKIQFWTHVTFLCLEVRLDSDNVFDYFLTTCAIAAEVALHSYLNGYDDVLPFASVFFCAFFENELYEGFHKAGGWVGLVKYAEKTCCPDLYEMIDAYINDLSSPSEHLPIMITITYEKFAAKRREKLMSSLLFKIGKIEREIQTKALVAGILHWDFMENQRISEMKPGILKRMPNLRHKKTIKTNKSVEDITNDESSETDEEVSDIASETCSSVDTIPRLPEEVQPKESVVQTLETSSSSEDINLWSLNIAESAKERKTSEGKVDNCEIAPKKEKFGSSSRLRELCNFYESLSVATKSMEGNTNDNYFLPERLEPCERVKIDIQQENMDSKTYPGFFLHSDENGGTSSGSKTFNRVKLANATEPLDNNVLCEFQRSFEGLGFRCLNVGKTAQVDEKSLFPNYAEVVKTCRYFQNKYSSVQFAILIPNDYFKDKSPSRDAAKSEKHDEANIKHQGLNDVNRSSCFEQQISKISTTDSAIFTTPPPPVFRSANKLSRFTVTKVDENHFNSNNGLTLVKSCSDEVVQSSRILTTHVNENESTTRKNEISRFSVTRVHESELMSKNETKIARFTVTKVNENKSQNESSILGKSWTNETTKISRFSVTKVDDNQLISKGRKSSLKKPHTLEQTKISKFTVTKVQQSQANSPVNQSTGYNEMTDVTENETVLFQENGNVKYQKRVSFAELPFIRYYSDVDFQTSCESLDQNSVEDLSSSKNSEEDGNERHTLKTPTLRTSTIGERRQFFERHSFSAGESSKGDYGRFKTEYGSSLQTENAFSEGLSSRDKNRRGSMSFRKGFLDKIFKRASDRNDKVDKSAAEGMEENDKDKQEHNL